MDHRAHTVSLSLNLAHVRNTFTFDQRDITPPQGRHLCTTPNDEKLCAHFLGINLELLLEYIDDVRSDILLESAEQPLRMTDSRNRANQTSTERASENNLDFGYGIFRGYSWSLPSEYN